MIALDLKVLEGLHPRGTTLREALRKFASQRVLRGLCGGLFEGFAGSPRGPAEVCWGPRDFPSVVTISLRPWGLLDWNLNLERLTRVTQTPTSTGNRDWGGSRKGDFRNS